MTEKTAALSSSLWLFVLTVRAMIVSLTASFGSAARRPALVS